MISLFNSLGTLLFHFLLIQELYINFFSQLPKTDPNWHMMPPLMPNPNFVGDDARVKSVIYVNNQLPSYCFSAIETNTALVAGITVALPSPHPPLHLLSAYLPPNQAQTMSSLTPILSALRPDPILRVWTQTCTTPSGTRPHTHTLTVRRMTSSPG